MRAAVFNRYGGSEVMEVRDDVALPFQHSSEMDPFMVKVKVRASSVNPVDWKVQKKESQDRSSLLTSFSEQIRHVVYGTSESLAQSEFPSSLFLSSSAFSQQKSFH